MQVTANNSFNPNPLRSTNNMAGRACHVVGSTTQVGLTQGVRAHMQQIAISLASVSAFLATLIYLYALFKLYGVIASERPEWVNRRGSLSFFYSAFPPAADPHIGLAVVRRSFSSTIRELQSPLALVYAKRIRWALAIPLFGFGVLMVAGAMSGP